MTGWRREHGQTHKKRPENGGAASNTQKPIPPAHRCNLSNLQGVRREMARVYRDMRYTGMDCAKGTKLVFVLGQIAKILEVSDLEARIAALEAKYGVK